MIFMYIVLSMLLYDTPQPCITIDCPCHLIVVKFHTEIAGERNLYENYCVKNSKTYRGFILQHHITKTVSFSSLDVVHYTGASHL